MYKGPLFLVIAVSFLLGNPSSGWKLGGVQSRTEVDAAQSEPNSNIREYLDRLAHGDAMEGYDGDDRQVRRQKRDIKETIPVALGVSVRDKTVGLVKTPLIAQRGTKLGQIQVLSGFPATNPVQEVYWRLINLQGGRRVELLNAIIRPSHLRLGERIDFPSSVLNYMKIYLGPKAQDEAGHLVANVLGGPPETYNLAPQTPLVNRNVGSGGSRNRLNAWYDVETVMKNFLIENNYPKALVEWSVIVGYPNYKGLIYTGRPTSFTYFAVFRDKNGKAVKVITGTMNN